MSIVSFFLCNRDVPGARVSFQLRLPHYKWPHRKPESQEISLQIYIIRYIEDSHPVEPLVVIFGKSGPPNEVT